MGARRRRSGRPGQRGSRPRDVALRRDVKGRASADPAPGPCRDGRPGAPRGPIYGRTPAVRVPTRRTAMADDPLRPIIEGTYVALADLLTVMPLAQWDTPSLCEGWRVREVVAHLTM